MPLATWPLGLPVDPLARGYDEQLGKNTLRTDMEAGRPKKRRRFTRAVRPLSLMIDLTRTQVEIPDDFFTVTLAEGALNFTYLHPRKQVAVEVGFKEPPSWRPVSQSHGQKWEATLPLEIFP